MFSPSQQDVRRFFCQVYAKQLLGPLVDPLESLAAEWINRHPEYQPVLQNEEAALSAKFDDSTGNPFLHLSMHLSISEQCSIDQPQGIRQAVELLAAKRSDLHDAHHEVMEPCCGRANAADDRQMVKRILIRCNAALRAIEKLKAP
jgi:hypothetical protein